MITQLETKITSKFRLIRDFFFFFIYENFEKIDQKPKQLLQTLFPMRNVQINGGLIHIRVELIFFFFAEIDKRNFLIKTYNAIYKAFYGLPANLEAGSFQTVFIFF